MRFSSFIIKTFLIVLFLPGFLWVWAQIPHPPRSILFITIDTLNRAHMSVYGYEKPTTPFMESLAKQGTLFQQVYATGSWTPPTMATLLYGGTPYDHGVTDWTTPPRPHVQKRAWPSLMNLHYGYATGFFSNHPGLKTPGTDPCAAFRVCQIFNAGYPPADVAVDAAIRWLRTRPRNRPVLAWVHLFDPHEPFLPPRDWADYWTANASLPSLPAPRCIHDYPYGVGCIPEYIYPGAWPTDYSMQRMTALYDADIANTDRSLEVLLNALPGKGKYWVISVTADHGEIIYYPETPDHPALYYSHGTYLYDELIRIPWILRAPGLKPGQVIEDLVSQADIPATVMSLAGNRVPDSWQGLSLVHGDSLSGHRRWATSWELRAPWAMLITPVDRVWVRSDAIVVLNETGERVKAPSQISQKILTRVINSLRNYTGSYEPTASLPLGQRQILRQIGYVGP